MEPITLTITSLQERPHLAPLLARWYKDDSPDYFAGRTEADIAGEFFTLPATGELPVVLVALNNSTPCGTVALRITSVTTRPDLSPWLAGLYVVPELRDRGIGWHLLESGELAASRLGVSALYAGTSTANTMLEARGWQPLETIEYHGYKVTLYRKLLGA